MNPALWSDPAVTVTVARRTPSMVERNSWVSGNSSAPARSADMSIHRAHRSSTGWRALQAANQAASHKPPAYQLATQQVEDKSLKPIQYLTPGLLG